MNQITAPSIDLQEITPVAGVDIEILLRMNSYNPARLQPVYDIVDRNIKNFDRMSFDEERSLPFGGRVVQSYGSYMADHLEWTASTLGNFLYFLGYDEEIVDKVEQAFQRHDAGKILQPGLWKITEEKQTIGDEEKARRLQHGVLGIDVIKSAIVESGIEFSSEEMAGFEAAYYLCANHHERLNKSGPNELGADDICPILRAAAIIDTFHGKLKAGKTTAMIFQEMAGGKHQGQFDLKMLDQFQNFLSAPAVATKPIPQFQP